MTRALLFRAAFLWLGTRVLFAFGGLLAADARRLARAGCAIVITGHEVPTLMDSVDRVVWCTAGTTYDLGTPAEASAEWHFQREYLGWA